VGINKRAADVEA